MCEALRGDYSEVRPHSAIGHNAPMELARALRARIPALSALQPGFCQSRWSSIGGKVSMTSVKLI